MNVLAMGLLGANRLPRMTGNLREAIGEPRCALHARGQPGHPDATQGPGNDAPPER
jgi:hypothetical protein